MEGGTSAPAAGSAPRPCPGGRPRRWLLAHLHCPVSVTLYLCPALHLHPVTLLLQRCEALPAGPSPAGHTSPSSAPRAQLAADLFKPLGQRTSGNSGHRCRVSCYSRTEHRLKHPKSLPSTLAFHRPLAASLRPMPCTAGSSRLLGSWPGPTGRPRAALSQVPGLTTWPSASHTAHLTAPPHPPPPSLPVTGPTLAFPPSLLAALSSPSSEITPAFP